MLKRGKYLSWGLAALLLTGLGCARMLKDADLASTESLDKLVNELTEGTKNTPGKIKRLAIVGFTSEKQVMDTEIKNAGLMGLAAGMMNTAAMDAYVCSSLERSSALASETLSSLGFEILSADKVTASTAYSAMGRQLPSDKCSGSRGTRFYLDRDGELVYLDAGGDTRKLDLAKVNRLVEELGVDGMVAAYFRVTNNGVCKEGRLSLFTKGSDGRARVAWEGKVKPGSVQVDDPMKEAVHRTFNYSFKLMAARMAADLR